MVLLPSRQKKGKGLLKLECVKKRRGGCKHLWAIMQKDRSITLQATTVPLQQGLFNSC